jgi:hypothetical protein
MDVTINGYRILNNYSKNSPFRNELEEKMIKYNIQDKEFVYNLVFDVLLSVIFKRLVIDVVKTDIEFSKKDKEYDAVNCLYINKPSSFSKYITQKYGDNYLQFLNSF